jgi:anti-sigma28 factor (negative regulator of flagellin synthesis)
MKIDNINNITSYNSIPSDKTVKKNNAEEKAAYSSDRVEIGTRTTVVKEYLNVKDRIIQAEKQGASQERLDALKKKISQNEYQVDTEDIAKSIL